MKQNQVIFTISAAEYRRALTELARAADGNVEGSEEMRRVAERLKTVSGRLTRLAERYRS